MSSYVVRITKVTTNGPYAYLIIKDGVGFKDANTLASVSAALSGVQTDIGADVAGAGTSVSSVAMTVLAQ